jgi:hypothetical protein
MAKIKVVLVILPCLVAAKNKRLRVCAEASAWVERELRGHFHYELARDLRQLEPVIAG